MSDYDDFLFDMGSEPISENQVEELLRGMVDPRQYTGDLAHLAELVAAARVPGTPEELSNEQEMVAAFKDALGHNRVKDIGYARNRRIHSSLLAAKVAGVLVTATALTGTAVAAYHGDLPNTFQTTISSGLAKVGISVPSPVLNPPRPTSQEVALPPTTTTVPKSTTTTQGRSTATTSGSHSPTTLGSEPTRSNGFDLFGMCSAYLSQRNLSSVSTTTSLAGGVNATSGGTRSGSSIFKILSDMANHNGESLTQLCAGATPPSSGSNHNASGVPSNGHDNRGSAGGQHTSAGSPRGNTATAGPGNNANNGNSAHDSHAFGHFDFNSLFFGSSQQTGSSWNGGFGTREQTSSSVGGQKSSSASSRVPQSGIFKVNGKNGGSKLGKPNH